MKAQKSKMARKIQMYEGRERGKIINDLVNGISPVKISRILAARRIQALHMHTTPCMPFSWNSCVQLPISPRLRGALITTCSRMYKQPTTTSGEKGKCVIVMYCTFLLHDRLYYAKGSTRTQLTPNNFSNNTQVKE